MTTPEAQRVRQKVGIWLSALTLLVLIVVVVLQIHQNRDFSHQTDKLNQVTAQLTESTSTNRATICTIARLIVLAPDPPPPATSGGQQHLQKQIKVANVFVALSHKIDCRDALDDYGIHVPPGN